MTEIEKLEAKVLALEFLVGVLFMRNPTLQAEMREAYKDLDDILLKVGLTDEQLAEYARLVRKAMDER